jgi:hypothetical protein
MRTAAKATLGSAEAHLQGKSINRGVVIVRVVEDEVTKLAYSDFEPSRPQP